MQATVYQYCEWGQIAMATSFTDRHAQETISEGIDLCSNPGETVAGRPTD